MPGVSLKISFARGERPHLFWVSDWSAALGSWRRWKILSKRTASGAIDVCVVEERSDGQRRTLARHTLPPDQPAGWLDRWANDFASDLEVKLLRFDLRGVRSEAEWLERVRTLGWLDPID